MADFNWPELIGEAIKALRGDLFFVKGAKLRAKVVELATEQGQDLPEHLRESGRKFSDLVDAVQDVVIEKTPGTDMSVYAAVADAFTNRVEELLTRNPREGHDRLIP